MNIKIQVLTICLSFAFFTSCTTFKIPKYTANIQNIEKMKSISASSINVTSEQLNFNDDNSTQCRLVGRIATTDGHSFREYILNSLNEELALAGKSKKDSSNLLALTFKDISMRSTSSKWSIDMEVKYKNSTSTINFEQAFEDNVFTALNAQAACEKMAVYFSDFSRIINLKIVNFILNSEKK